MDQNKLFLAKLLGEIYRVQKHSEIPCAASDARIYGLLSGFEHVIEEEIERIGVISQEHFGHTIDILDEYHQDTDKLNSFKGFYDIERKLEAGGVDRSMAIRILAYLNANGQFQEVIAKMDTSGSPSECRKFDLDDFDA